MAEAGKHNAAKKNGWRRIVGKIVGFVERSWALGLGLLVLWLSWRALYYLLATLVLPPQAPPQVVQLPLRANEQYLEAAATGFAGLRAVEKPRMPLGHYHEIDYWYQPDAFNNCTQSGCHAPLPHHKHKTSRAFLNLHATSVQCGVCHMQTREHPLDLTWYGLKDGKAARPPAILRAYTLLTNEDERQKMSPTGYQSRLVGLIRQAATDAQGSHELSLVADYLAAYRPDGEIYHDLLEAAKGVLERHFRGEYGEKLALVGPSGQPRLGYADTQAAIDEYLAKKDTLSADQREALLARVHPRQRKQTLNCLDCHVPAGGLIDFRALGYPPERVDQLHRPTLRQMIQDIMKGQTFHLPSFGDGSETAPASAPASAPAP